MHWIIDEQLDCTIVDSDATNDNYMPSSGMVVDRGDDDAILIKCVVYAPWVRRRADDARNVVAVVRDELSDFLKCARARAPVGEFTTRSSRSAKERLKQLALSGRGLPGVVLDYHLGDS